jgi:hypothetical protein
MTRKMDIHIKLSDDEYKNLAVVACHVGVGISDFVRPIIFDAVKREIEQRSLRAALPRRAQSAPLSK